MGCGCQGAPKEGEQWTVHFADGTQDTKVYANETEARVALARTGKTGTARKQK